MSDTVPFLRNAVNSSCGPVILLGDSFGACLALRIALKYPELVHRMVLVNSATTFASSLGGLPAVLTSTNLLGFFPEPLYNVAQVCSTSDFSPQANELFSRYCDATNAFIL